MLDELRLWEIQWLGSKVPTSFSVVRLFVDFMHPSLWRLETRLQQIVENLSFGLACVLLIFGGIFDVPKGD